MKEKNDHRNKFSNLSNWKEEAWKKKNQGFNGIRIRNLRDTGAMLYQLSYEATHCERGRLIEFISSREEWNDVKYIWNNSYLNCGCKWKWRIIIAVNFPIYAIGFQFKQLVEHRTGIAEVTGSNPVEAQIFFFFQASSFRLLKLENLLRWSFFTFIYNRSSNMNYFIYTSHHFTPHGKIRTQLIDLAPNMWLHSSVGRASHRYRGGHGFESRWSPDFFSGFFFPVA